jgi:PKHD-type hydroxylase
MTALLEPPVVALSVEPQQTPAGAEPVFTFALRTLDQYADYCWFENMLSREEVTRVLGHANLIEPEKATIGGNRGLDYGIRHSVVRWLRPCEENVWLFRRITDLVWSCNQMSVTIQLSDPSDYEGGDMEFLCGPEIVTAAKPIGTAIVFPSYIMHRVTPVTRGLRRSVVAWVSGPPYR